MIRKVGDYELMTGTMIHTTCTYFESAVYFTMIPLLNMKVRSFPLLIDGPGPGLSAV